MRSLLAILTLLPLAAPASAQGPQGSTPKGFSPAGWSEEIRTELAATLVVRGRIRVPDSGCLERAMLSRGTYVRLVVDVQEVLKGESPATRVPLTFFAAPREHPHGYFPSADDMRRHVGQERILFLISYTAHHYFLVDRFRGTAIRTPSPRKLDELRRSIAKHEMLATTPPEPDPMLIEPIGDLLDYAMEGPEQQLRAFMLLERLGPSAIPTLAWYLEDDRELPTQALLLQDVWSTPIPALREYRPELVRDAICTVLHQRTGEQFGLEYSRPQPQQRQRECDAWRVFAHYVADDESIPPAELAGEIEAVSLASIETVAAEASAPVATPVDEP